MHISLIIFLTSILATSLSAMSGGGASIINVPVMFWLGIPFPMAMSAQKISSVFWLPTASYNYLKGKKVPWGFLILFSIIGLIGVYLGVEFITHVNTEVMEKIIGILILCLVLYTYVHRKMGLTKQRIYSRFKKILSYFFAPLLGFYESIFGSGNGIMFSLIGMHTRGFDFVEALGAYFSVGFPWVVYAAGLYIIRGYFDVSIMLPTLLGSLIGGYIGSRYARYKGNVFIKNMFVIIGGILGLKLLIS